LQLSGQFDQCLVCVVSRLLAIKRNRFRAFEFQPAQKQKLSQFKPYRAVAGPDFKIFVMEELDSVDGGQAIGVDILR